MFNIGPEKLMMVLLIALIVLGPDKLPNAARQIGRYLNDFRRISQGFQDELRGAMDMTTVTTVSPTPAPTPGESALDAVVGPDADAAADDQPPPEEPGDQAASA